MDHESTSDSSDSNDNSILCNNVPDLHNVDVDISVLCTKNMTSSVVKLHDAVNKSKRYNFQGLREPLLSNGMNFARFEEKLV